MLYSADLAGTLCCWQLCKDGSAPLDAPPTLVWKTNVGTPLFSTPTLSESDGGGIFVGCTNKDLCCINTKTGEIKWTLKTEGPIFSSPMFIEGGDENAVDVVVVGSHDGYVYCADARSGSLLWKQRLGSSAVYASPAAASISVAAGPPSLGGPSEQIRDRTAAVVACNTAGELCAFAQHTGRLLARTTLHGEVFSSPVCCPALGTRHCGKGNGVVKVLVGCRDDYIHCLNWLH